MSGDVILAQKNVSFDLIDSETQHRILIELTNNSIPLIEKKKRKESQLKTQIFVSSDNDAKKNIDIS